MLSKDNVKNLFKFIILLILLVFLCFLANYLYTTYLIRLNFGEDVNNIAELNKKQVFSIDEITLYSSAGATPNENSNKSVWDLNIYQYTDIAIKINNFSYNGLTYENTLDKVYIDNIKYVYPERGNPSFCYKNILDFGKPTFLEEILDTANFNIIDTNKKIDYTNLELYTDCSTPICLSYVNKNIKTNSIIPSSSIPLSFDGNLLKRGTVSLNSINAKVSFNVHIINKLQQHYICNVLIDIPLETYNSSIYDGYIIDSKDVNYNFYRLK